MSSMRFSNPFLLKERVENNKFKMLPIIPTFRGAVLIGITIIAFCVMMINPSLATGLITSLFIALLISSFILSCFSLFELELSRDICLDGTIGEDVYLPLTIKNKTGHRRQPFVVRESFGFSRDTCNEFVIHALLPLEKRTVERYVLASSRGKFKLARVKLIGGDPAGLFQNVRTFDLTGELTLFPAIQKISSLELQTKNKIRSTVSGQPLGISGQGQDLFGLREYRHGDPVRLVHWKASARQQKLIIKEFETKGMNRISVLLDVDLRYVGNDKYDNNFEYLVKTSSSIMHYLSGMYCQASFITSCDKKGSIICEEGSAFSIAGTTDSILAELQPGNMNLEKLLEVSLNIVPDDSIIYCLTMSASDNMYKYFDLLSAKGIEVRWLFAPPECFPKIVPGIPMKDPDTSLMGYGMQSPPPFIVKRGQDLEDALG